MHVVGVGTAQFSQDAGGIFARQNGSMSGLMVVVQNKHIELDVPARGADANLTWTEYSGMGYTCASNEYKGTALNRNGTAAGCLVREE